MTGRGGPEPAAFANPRLHTLNRNLSKPRVQRGPSSGRGVARKEYFFPSLIQNLPFPSSLFQAMGQHWG